MMAKRTRRVPQPGRPPRQAQPPRRNPINRTTILIGSVAVVGVLAAVIAFSLLASDDSGNANEHSNAIAGSISTVRGLPTEDFTVGDADAPLEMELFEDFQCLHCVRFTAISEPTLLDEYVREGKLKITFRNYPVLGPESALAALGSVCAAEQDGAWPFGLELFRLQAAAGQIDSARVNVGRFTETSLADAAAGAGLERDQFRACLQSPAALTAVEEQVARGTALGVQGTPAFALNGQLVGSPPSGPEGWRELLDAVLAATP